MSMSGILRRYAAAVLNISFHEGHMNFDISYDLTTTKVILEGWRLGWAVPDDFCRFWQGQQRNAEREEKKEMVTTYVHNAW